MRSFSYNQEIGRYRKAFAELCGPWLPARHQWFLCPFRPNFSLKSSLTPLCFLWTQCLHDLFDILFVQCELFSIFLQLIASLAKLRTPWRVRMQWKRRPQFLHPWVHGAKCCLAQSWFTGWCSALPARHCALKLLVTPLLYSGSPGLTLELHFSSLNFKDN